MRRNRVDPEGLLEFSVVYTNRALNHMSRAFQEVLRDLSCGLKEVYHAQHVAIVPGNGTTGMEAVVRQLAKGKKCLCLRNGFFNFRWSQILNLSQLCSAEVVIKAQSVSAVHYSAYVPATLEEVIKRIREERPNLVFATHVETSSGIRLTEAYIKEVARVTHEVGGWLIVDSIASGATWLDMQELNIDLLLTAPQKCWASTPCCALIMVNGAMRQYIDQTQSDSFALDLKKWFETMEVYERGGFAYYATMPTDSLKQLRDSMAEAKKLGLKNLKIQQEVLGREVRKLLKMRGFSLVADDAFAAWSIVVAYTDDLNIHSGKKWAEVGVQISSGVPLQCDEPSDFTTFRIGLLGWDKLNSVASTVAELEQAIGRIQKL
ncbi:MAG: aminotransferase class V-fold PLP-dependent enzyme [Neisseriaceae bacterium]